MILGHLTVTYVAGKQLEKVYPFLAQTPALIFGAFLPDLIDKPTAIFFDIPSRGIFHSVIVLSLLFFGLAAMFPKRRSTVMAVGVGAVLHLMEDLAGPTIIFWPLLGTWPDVPPIGFFQKIANYYLYHKFPYQLAAEAVSYPFFIWLLIQRKRVKPTLEHTEETVNPQRGK